MAIYGKAPYASGPRVGSSPVDLKFAGDVTSVHHRTNGGASWIRWNFDTVH